MKTPMCRTSLKSSRTLLAALLGTLALSAGCERPEVADDTATASAQHSLAVVSTGAPTKFSITANSLDGSGTSNVVWAFYQNGTGLYSCLFDSIAAGETKTCTLGPTSLPAPGTSPGFDRFLLTGTSDGFKVTKVSVTTNGLEHSVSRFDNSVKQLDCDGCTDDSNCNGCWVDTDGHKSCKIAVINMDWSNSVSCQAY